MVCEQVRNELSAYLDGELAPPEAAAVRDHVDACPECREVLEELRATIDLVGGLPCCGAPKHLAADVQREIERRMILAAPAAPADEAPQERSLPIRRASPWPRVLAVAATLVLGLGIGLLSYLGTPGPRVRQPASRVARETVFENDDFAFRQAAARPDDAAGKDLGPGHDKATLYGATAEAEEDAYEAERLATRADAPVLTGEPVLADTNGSTPALAGASWGMAVEETGAALGGVAGGGSAGTAADAAAIGAIALDEEAPGTLDLQGDRLDVLATPEVALQLAVVSVMTGRAGVEDLRRVATPDNLARVANQLVIETESRDRANQDLTRLLAANGVAPLDGRVEARTDGQAGAVEAKLKRPEEPRPSHAPAGFYYLAHHDGEDTYVVVTDRDNLSRFGSQLAAADDLAVSERSSDLLRGVRGLQLARRAREHGIVNGLETAERVQVRADEGEDLELAPSLEKGGASVFGRGVSGEAGRKEGAKEETREPKADLGKVAEPSAPAPAVAARKVSEEASNLDAKAAVTGDEPRVQGEVGQAGAGAPVQEGLGQPAQAPAAPPPGAEEAVARAPGEMPAQHEVGSPGKPAAPPPEASRALGGLPPSQAEQPKALGRGEARPLGEEARGTGRRENGRSAEFAPQKEPGAPRAAGAGGRSTPAAGAPVAGPRAGGEAEGRTADVPRAPAGGSGVPARGWGRWYVETDGAVAALGFPRWLGENQVLLVIRVLPAAKAAATKAAPEAKPAEAEVKEAPAEGGPKPAPSH
jgi:hypothetical protein